MKLIVLDRDGVINEDNSQTITAPDELIPIEGSLEAIARLHQAGYHIAVATNQSGIARGLIDLDTLHNIHKRMHELVAQAEPNLREQRIPTETLLSLGQP